MGAREWGDEKQTISWKAMPAAASFRDGTPNSGLPEFGDFDVQVGNSRLGWTRPQMRNCASGNLVIPGSMLRIAPE
jgi:hypothetical protein